MFAYLRRQQVRDIAEAAEKARANGDEIDSSATIDVGAETGSRSVDRDDVTLAEIDGIHHDDQQYDVEAIYAEIVNGILEGEASDSPTGVEVRIMFDVTVYDIR